MTAKRLIIIISVYLLSVTSDVIAGYCWKMDAWRAQVRRLSRLSEDTEVDAVVVARFKKNNHDIYTFDLIETWPHFNEGFPAIEPNKEAHSFKVRVPRHLLKCAPKYDFFNFQKYYLILKKMPSHDNVDFKLLEQLVPTSMSGMRRKIYEAVCKEKDCPLVGLAHISDSIDWRSNNIIMNEGFVSWTTCRVQTSLWSDEYKLEWFKDNVRIDPVKEFYVDGRLISVFSPFWMTKIPDEENRVQVKGEEGASLVIMEAKPEFSGEYTCRVTVMKNNLEEMLEPKLQEMIKPYKETNAEHEVVTKISVVSWPYDEIYCKSNDHCNNNGVCMFNVNHMHKKKCICDLGYEGDTCGDKTTDADHE